MTDRFSRYRRFLRAQLAEGPRYCTQCHRQRPRAGGREIRYNRGRNARWVCASCTPAEHEQRQDVSR